MAVYNELLVGRFNRALQKLTGIKGAPPVRQLASEIMPVLPMFWGAELRYLESWGLFATSSNVPAGGVGNAAFYRLRNPVGSNVIAVIFAASCSPAAASLTDSFVWEFGPATTDLANFIGAAGAIDPRGPVTKSTLVTSTTAAGGGGAGTLGSFGNQSGFLINSQGWQFFVTDQQEVPVLPGQAFGFQQFTSNQAYLVNLMWRERFLEDSERT